MKGSLRSRLLDQMTSECWYPWGALVTVRLKAQAPSLLCQWAQGRSKPSLRSGTKLSPLAPGQSPCRRKALAQCQTSHSCEIFTSLVSSIMAGGYMCTFHSFIQTLSRLWPSCLVDSFPYMESSEALFQNLSSRELLLVRMCAVVFCLQIWPFLLGSPVLRSPGAVLPGKPSGLSITQSQGNRLSLSSCFSEPGHSACNEAEIKQSLYFSPVQTVTFVFPSPVSYPPLEHVRDTTVIYFNIGVFGGIDRKGGQVGYY